MSASNSIECIDQFIGEKLIGVIEDWSHSDITKCKALVFESGYALVLGENGSYWSVDEKEVQHVVSNMQKYYKQLLHRQEQLLKFADQDKK